MSYWPFQEQLGRPVDPEEMGAYVWRFDDKNENSNIIGTDALSSVNQPNPKSDNPQIEFFASNNVDGGMVFVHDNYLAKALQNESNISIVNGFVAQRDLCELLSIDYHGYNIVDIDPLQYCINLRRCKLNNNQIRNIDVLSKCQELRELDLSGNDIVDISPIGSLKRIRILSLESNRIVNITPLCGLCSLRIAILSRNRIADVEALTNLSNLQYLELSCNNVKDISILKHLYNLRILWIDNNPLQEHNGYYMLTQISIIVSNNTYWEQGLPPIYINK